MGMDTATQILQRLLQGAGLRRDRQLAALLEVTPQAISQARRKGKVPDRWVVQIAARFRLSSDWILTGKGSPRNDEEQIILPRSAPDLPAGVVRRPPRRRFNAWEYQTISSDLPGSVTFPGLLPPPGGEPKQSVPPQPPASPSPQRETRVLNLHSSPPDACEVALIPLVEARLAAGVSSLENGGDVLNYFSFRQDWLLRKGNPDHMVLMKVCGDSMEPEIRHGDMVLVDESNKQLYGHAIYAVAVNDEIYIKQVETHPGSRLLLRSFNPKYAPITCDLQGDLQDSVRIIGRILWWCREA